MPWTRGERRWLQGMIQYGPKVVPEDERSDWIEPTLQRAPGRKQPKEDPVGAHYEPDADPTPATPAGFPPAPLVGF
jgi:hypothetical protein